MLQTIFHGWERRLAAATTDRVVRPFDWGLDWIPSNGHPPGASPAQVLGDWIAHVMSDTDAFFTPEPTADYTFERCPDGDVLRFPSAFVTPHPENNTVYCRYFPARVKGSRDHDARLKPRAPDDARVLERADDRDARLKPRAPDDARVLEPADDRDARLKPRAPDDARVLEPADDQDARLKPRAPDDARVLERVDDRDARLKPRAPSDDARIPDDGARGFSRASRRRARHSRAAVLVLPQWNADAAGHAGLCRLLAWNGMSALRLSLPYHDRRMPPELHRADYIVSANLARTIQVCRQAVLDARRAIAWLAMQGYERIGILGTSLGSCLALLTTAHEPLVRAQALNHISPHFADVVWRGLSTEHVRAGLDGHVELDLLRALWKPISPRWYLERVRNRRTLLLYARYDLTFPVDLSQDLVGAFRDLDIPHEVAVLRCGHYTSGRTPFKYVDGWVLTRFLKRALSNDR